MVGPKVGTLGPSLTKFSLKGVSDSVKSRNFFCLWRLRRHLQGESSRANLLAMFNAAHAGSGFGGGLIYASRADS